MGPRARRIAVGVAALFAVATACAADPTPRTSSPIGPDVVESASARPDAAPRRAPAAADGDHGDDELWTELATAHRNAEVALDAVSAVVDPPVGDPDLVSLGATTTAPMLNHRIELIAGRRRQGWATRYPTDSRARDEMVSMTQVDPTTVDIEVCVLDDAVLFDRVTGEVVNDEVATIRQRHRFVAVDGLWKLAERETLARGEDARCFGQ